MKTGDRRTFTLNLIDAGISKDVDFIFIEGVGYVADRNVCVGKSYNYLEECGYVTGKEITLDGERYNCRILRCTEWDDCMEYDDRDEVWHWDEAFSWVRSLEYERAKCSYRVRRGYYAASYLNSGDPTDTGAACGFRPALEVLNSETLTAETTSPEAALLKAVIDAAVLDAIENYATKAAATFAQVAEMAKKSRV